MKPLRVSNASSAALKSRPAEWARRRSSIAAWSGSPDTARNASSAARFSFSIGGPDLKRRLFEEAVGDLARRAPADRIDPGDREQILDQRLRAGVIGALQRRQHAGLGERALARAAENGLEAQPAGDAAAQAPTPRLRNFQGIRAPPRTGPRRRAAPSAWPRPPQPPPPWRARTLPRRPPRRRGGRNSRARSGSARRLGAPRARKTGPR